MASNSDVETSALAGANTAADGVEEYQVGNRRVRRRNPLDLLKAARKAKGYAARDAGQGIVNLAEVQLPE